MESQEWMDMVSRMYRWNKLGFISPDALMDSTSSSAKIKSGTYMSMLAPSKPGYKSQISAECGREMIVFRLGQDIIKSTGVSAVVNCLNRESPDPVAAVQLMNELYTDPELSTLLVWGEEGIDYVTDPDGFIRFPDDLDPMNAEWYHTMNWEMPNQYICPVWVGDPLDLGSRIMEFNAQAETSIALGFTFDNSAYTAEYAALQNIYDEYAHQLLYGFLDPVSGTEEFNEKLKSAGLNRYIAEKQRQFDVWYVTNYGKK
jgi:putative aldouronate transport system substrate-binding protein